MAVTAPSKPGVAVDGTEAKTTRDFILAVRSKLSTNDQF